MMKTSTSSLFTKCAAVAAILLLTAVAPFRIISQSFNETTCNSKNSPGLDPDNPNKLHWKQNVTVYVYINSGAGQFEDAQQRQCIKDAFDAWNNNNGASGNASGVTFAVMESTTKFAQIVQATETTPRQVQSLSTPIPTSNMPLFQLTEKFQDPTITVQS